MTTTTSRGLGLAINLLAFIYSVVGIPIVIAATISASFRNEIFSFVEYEIMAKHSNGFEIHATGDLKYEHRLIYRFLAVMLLLTIACLMEAFPELKRQPCCRCYPCRQRCNTDVCHERRSSRCRARATGDIFF